MALFNLNLDILTIIWENSYFFCKLLQSLLSWERGLKYVNTGREVDVLNLKVEFSRNVPNNLTEIVDTVTKLDGKVDKETLLSLLPFIDNPKEVLEKLEADKERDRQNTDPYSTQNITEDSNYLFPNLNAQNSRQEALNAQGATIPQPEQ